MSYLLAILLGSAVLAAVLSFLFTWWRTSGKISGNYNRARLLPGEIDARLRTHRRVHIIIWMCIACLIVAAGILLHWMYAESIAYDAGFWNIVLFDSLRVVNIPFPIGHPLIYALFLLLMLLASWLGVRAGVKLGARGFLLTRRLPAVA